MSKKSQILDTALRLFNVHNYSTIGIDRIIEESNVAKMTFYKYFPSKEKLIYECLLNRSMELKKSILADLDEQNTPLIQLKKIYEWHITWFGSAEFNGCMFQKAMLDILVKYPSVIEPINDYRQWLHKTISHIFLQMNINDKFLVDIFIFILDGMIMQAKVQNFQLNAEYNWTYILKIINLELEKSC